MTVIHKVGSNAAAGRDFTLLQSWEDALPVTLTEPYIADLYKDSTFGTGYVDALNLSGVTTTPTNNITIRAAAGQGFKHHPNVATNRYAYVPANGVAIFGTVGGVCANVVLDGLQISAPHDGYWMGEFANVLVKDCIVSWRGSDNNVNRVGTAYGSSGVFVNTLLINYGLNGNIVWLGNNPVYINCTVVTPVDIATRRQNTRGLAAIYSEGSAYNCAVFGFSYNRIGGWNVAANQKYNASSGDWSIDSSNQSYITYIDYPGYADKIFAQPSSANGLEDFRPANNLSPLWNKGVVYGGYTLDAIGVDRTSSAAYSLSDVGSYEFTGPLIGPELTGYTQVSANALAYVYRAEDVTYHPLFPSSSSGGDVVTNSRVVGKYVYTDLMEPATIRSLGFYDNDGAGFVGTVKLALHKWGNSTPLATVTMGPGTAGTTLVGNYRYKDLDTPLTIPTVGSDYILLAYAPNEPYPSAGGLQDYYGPNVQGYADDYGLASGQSDLVYTTNYLGTQTFNVNMLFKENVDLSTGPVLDPRNASLDVTLGALTDVGAGTIGAALPARTADLSKSLGAISTVADSRGYVGASEASTLGALTVSSAGTVVAPQTSPVRYIRDFVNGSTANTSSHWVEIQAFDANGTNRALGKTVIADNGAGGEGLISYVTDGVLDPNIYYASPATNASVTVDLGALFDIASIKRFHYFGDARSYYNSKTIVSPDGVTWYTVFDSDVTGTYAETASGKTDSVPVYTYTPPVERLASLNVALGILTDSAAVTVAYVARQGALAASLSPLTVVSQGFPSGVATSGNVNYAAIPDAILVQTGLTGSLATIQDDPTLADSTWLITSSTTSTLRASFPTPSAGKLLSGTQTFNVRWRKNSTTGFALTATIAIYENGTQKAVSSAVTIADGTSGQLNTFTWDPSILTDKTGAGVEIVLTQTGGGTGTVGSRRYMEVGSVRWASTYADVTYLPVGRVTETTSTLGSLSASSDGSVTGQYQGAPNPTATLGATLGALSPTVAGTVTPFVWTTVASENGGYTVLTKQVVRYGAETSYFYQVKDPGFMRFDNGTFGDPIGGVTKVGQISVYTADSSLVTNPLTSSSSGTVSGASANVSGDLSKALGTLVVTSTSAATDTASLAKSLNALTSSSDGSVANPAGRTASSTVTLGALTDSSASSVSTGAISSQSLGAVTVSSSVTTSKLPNVNVTLGAATSSASGNVSTSASSSVTLGSLLIVSDGGLAAAPSRTGDLGATLGQASAAATAGVSTGSALTKALNPLTSSSAGSTSTGAASGVVLGAVTSASSGTSITNATSSKSLGAATSTAASTVSTTANSSVTLGALADTSDGTVSAAGARNASLSASLGSVTASSTSSNLVGSVVSRSLGSATASSTSTVSDSAFSSQTLGALSSSAAGSTSNSAVSSKALGSLTSTATASATDPGVTSAVLALTLGSTTASSSSTVSDAASLTKALGSLIASSASSASDSATSSSTLGALTSTSIATAAIAVSLTKALDALTSSSTGGSQFASAAADLGKVLGGLTGSGSATVSTNGSVATGLSPATSSSSSTNATKAALTTTLGAIGSSSTAVILETGAMVANLGSMQSTVAVSVAVRALAAKVLGSLIVDSRLTFGDITYLTPDERTLYLLGQIRLLQLNGQVRNHSPLGADRNLTLKD